MIYIASPYSHPDPMIRSWRYYKALEYTGHCIKAGEVVFSPIVYGHYLALAGFAYTDHESWIDFNETILEVCSSMRVLTLPGWRESLGISHEIDFCYKNNIPMSEVSWG